MSVNVDPFVIPIPAKWNLDPELSPTINYLWRYLYDIRERTGGSVDLVSSAGADLSALTSRVSIAENDIDSLQTSSTSQQLEISDLQAADISLDSRVSALESDIQMLTVMDITAQLLAEITDLKKRIEDLERGNQS